MEREQEQIFSSTGTLGVTRRQYNRLYINPDVYSDNPSDVDTLSRLSGIIERNTDRVSRGVFRGAVSQAVLAEIQRNGLSDGLEVALPLVEFTGPQREGSWLIYWAHNDAARSLIEPQDTMLAETAECRESDVTPLERIQAVSDRGYSFTNQFTADDVEQVHALWGPTFGWERQEVVNLGQRLSRMTDTEPQRRDVWFSALRQGDQIVSLGMAEKLTIPVASGTLDLVESTEWRTRDDFAGEGLMSATLSMLNAQILSDQGNDQYPLIYAECNFQSRSDRAGSGAGFVIPERETAPQILVQNVNVGDGQAVPEGKLRDFTFMYVPVAGIERVYDKVQTNAMLEKLASF